MSTGGRVVWLISTIKRPFCPIPFLSPLPALASVKVMSSTVPINQTSDITAPTPQNTPLTHAPISAGLSRPTVPDISEDAEPAEEPTNVHDAVVGLVQGRLAGLLGKSSGYIESLPDGAKKTIEALKGVQVKQNELQNQYKRECLELEKKVESRVFFSLSLFYPPLHPSHPPIHPSICSLYSYHPIVNAAGSESRCIPLAGREGSALPRCLVPTTPGQSLLIRNRGR